MNWGYKILFVYLSFVGGIVWMVFKSATQKIDLVTTDYYAKELKYQDNIDQHKRTSALSAPATCTVANAVVDIVFPKEFTGKKISGEVFLYCPSDENKDYRQAFVSDNGTVQVNLPAGSKGANEIHVSWTSDDLSYYFEKKIVL